jgi:hypothetical protein
VQLPLAMAVPVANTLKIDMFSWNEEMLSSKMSADRKLLPGIGCRVQKALTLDQPRWATAGLSGILLFDLAEKSTCNEGIFR